jgi:hypothetical protein
MQEQAKRQEQDTHILHRAREWRQKDRIAITDKTNRTKVREEYHARQKLRDAIDKAVA